MKRKIALLVLCGAALLVVVGLLAFAVYAPHTTAAASSTTMLDSTNSVAAPDASMVSNTTAVDDGEDPVLVPVTRGGHECNGDSASSGGY